MTKTTALAALVILVLVTGCQKDHVEECVNEGLKGYTSEVWSVLSPDQQADARRDLRMECMRAAAGKK
jgi:hypothetical protein